jgi:hypothetical protein
MYKGDKSAIFTSNYEYNIKMSLLLIRYLM